MNNMRVATPRVARASLTSVSSDSDPNALPKIVSEAGGSSIVRMD
jgi:hypothetical protein